MTPETEYTWVSKDDGSPIPLDTFRQWVAEALDAKQRTERKD
jgi:hypothetical protein